MNHAEWIIMKTSREDENKTSFTLNEASRVSNILNIDFSTELFSLEDFKNGMNVELEHGTKFKNTNVTNNDPILTGKIALAHLMEFPDYYIRLKALEEAANEYWKNKNKHR